MRQNTKMRNEKKTKKKIENKFWFWRIFLAFLLCACEDLSHISWFHIDFPFLLLRRHPVLCSPSKTKIHFIFGRQKFYRIYFIYRFYFGQTKKFGRISIWFFEIWQFWQSSSHKYLLVVGAMPMKNNKKNTFIQGTFENVLLLLFLFLIDVRRRRWPIRFIWLLDKIIVSGFNHYIAV